MLVPVHDRDAETVAGRQIEIREPGDVVYGVVDGDAVRAEDQRRGRLQRWQRIGEERNGPDHGPDDPVITEAVQHCPEVAQAEVPPRGVTTSLMPTALPRPCTAQGCPDMASVRGKCRRSADRTALGRQASQMRTWGPASTSAHLWAARCVQVSTRKQGTALQRRLATCDRLHKSGKKVENPR